MLNKWNHAGIRREHVLSIKDRGGATPRHELLPFCIPAILVILAALPKNGTRTVLHHLYGPDMQKLLGMALMLCAYPFVAFSQNSDWIKIELPPEAGDAVIDQVLGAPNGRLLLKIASDWRSDDYVFYSDDHGENWIKVEFLQRHHLFQMAALCDGRLLVGFETSVFQSEDNGLTWSTLLEDPSPNWDRDNIEFVDFEQEPGGKILAEVFDGFFGGGLLSIGDESGTRWTGANTYGTGPNNLRTTVLRNSDQLLKASGFPGSLMTFDLADNKEKRDTLLKAGQHGEGPWHPTFLEVNNRGDILLATDNPDARYFGSSDGGATWSFSGKEGPDPSNRLYSLIRHDRHNNFFANGIQQLWYTDNLGVEWHQIGPDLNFTADTLYKGISIVELDSAGYVYVASPKEMFRSQNPVYSVTDVEDDTPEAGAESFGTAAVRLTPNPATNEFAVDFTAETQGLVTAELFDVRGCLVKQVFQRIFPAGEHCVTNKMDFQTAGVYILRLSVDGKVCSTPLTILR